MLTSQGLRFLDARERFGLVISAEAASATSAEVLRKS